MTAVLTSASGVLSLLEEPDNTLKVHALEKLNEMVDHFWVEIASSVASIEELCEEDDFPNRELAACVASKVFYHLEELDDAVKYALHAGNLFDVSIESEYVETLISKCIDDYVAVSVARYDAAHRPDAAAGDGGDVAMETKADDVIDARLEAVVQRMFDWCFQARQFKQAMGIAVESRRLDMIERSIAESDDKDEMLEYCFNLAQEQVSSRAFRIELLQLLVAQYRSLAQPDYINMCQCLLFLREHQAVADALDKLIKDTPLEDALMAYQVAFDLYENQDFAFLNKVSRALPSTDPDAEPDDTSTPTGAPAASSSTKPVEDKGKDEPDTYATRMRRLKGVLSGATPIDLYLHFLYGQNKTDLNILKKIKESLEPRSSVTHNATVMAHALFQCGTTVDTFLRDDLEWLGKATKWAKFNATASFGVIHSGHVKESQKLLEPYLPDGPPKAPFQEGGALFAMGLIHARHGESKIPFFEKALQDAGDDEVVQHGACLGVGLSAMATHNEDLFETLKLSLYNNDNAVAGEAAGVAMGLVWAGSGDAERVTEMMRYARETNHEKIIRGLTTGVALMCYAREEAADVIIEEMLRDKDPLIRYGGVQAVQLAYVGTSNNGAIKKLLHYAVSDVSDDVRRASVTALGFVLCNSPEQVPRIVGLLSESYNMNVRYGAALAVGIACAGSGHKEALELLAPLLKDRVDFVRQAALIATAMVLIQHNKKREPRVQELRDQIDAIVARKGDTMTKLGAILAAGILDAGGRNVTISLLSPAGHRKMAAIIGMAIFPNFWYWYPFTHFISLSFTPTAVIGLNKDLQIPENFNFTSNAPPSTFAYPQPIKIKKKEVAKLVPKATLSVTAKAKAKAKKKAGGEEKKSGDAMDIVEEEPEKKEEKKTDKPDKKDKPDEKTEMDEEEETILEEATTLLRNPCRVTPLQQKLVTFDETQRYRPLKKRLAGIVMLRDSDPTAEEQIFVPKAPKIGVPGISDDEPGPPEPFRLPERLHRLPA